MNHIAHIRFFYVIIGYNPSNNSGCIGNNVCMVFYNRSPHSVCDHLGGAEATLWWYRVGYEQQSLISYLSSSDQALMGFIALLPQMLGHEWQRCHLVGDQGTRAGFDYGTLRLCLSNGDLKTVRHYQRCIYLFYLHCVFFYRSTLCSSSASSSSSSRSYSPQISVEMNPAFTCESFYFSLYIFCLTIK